MGAGRWRHPRRTGLFRQYVAAGIGHSGPAGAEAARLLGRVAPATADPRRTARSLMATADGLTMRVLIGGLSVTEAERTLRAEVDRATG